MPQTIVPDPRVPPLRLFSYVVCFSLRIKKLNFQKLTVTPKNQSFWGHLVATAMYKIHADPNLYCVFSSLKLLLQEQIKYLPSNSTPTAKSKMATRGPKIVNRGFKWAYPRFFVFFNSIGISRSLSQVIE